MLAGNLDNCSVMIIRVINSGAFMKNKNSNV